MRACERPVRVKHLISMVWLPATVASHVPDGLYQMMPLADVPPNQLDRFSIQPCLKHLKDTRMALLPRYNSHLFGSKSF